MLSDTLSIEDLKARYADLKANGQDDGDFAEKVASSPKALETIPESATLTSEQIPGGWYWSVKVLRGQTIRIANPFGTPGIAMQIWSLLDRSERFNSADTIKVQWTAKIGKGRVLLSDMGRAIMGITEDTGGYNDCIVGHSTMVTNLRRYGEGVYWNSRDNFLIAASKLGYSKRDLHQSFSPFAGVATDQSGHLVWDSPAQIQGAFIDLRAEMDVQICISNCPHPMAPGTDYAPKPVDVTIWDAGPIEPDDLCRTGTVEAKRAYENTDRLFA